MYRRHTSLELEKRLHEDRNFIQILIGPRQTGKTTAAKQALESCGLPFHYMNADFVRFSSVSQIAVEWEQAHTLS